MPDDEVVRWVVVIPRLPSDPSRYRVAVWRELRRTGAVQVGQGTWALPASNATSEQIAKLEALTAPSGGDLLVLVAQPWAHDKSDPLQVLYDDARRAEWDEFRSECGKALAELGREIETQKFTLAELDEEEQNVDRLRRWHRELTIRDRFGAGDREEMQARLDQCFVELAHFTELVYDAVGLAS